MKFDLLHNGRVFEPWANVNTHSCKGCHFDKEKHLCVSPANKLCTEYSVVWVENYELKVIKDTGKKP